MTVNNLVAKLLAALRHSLTTRLLFTCIPSEMYATSTLDVLLAALVDDLEHLHVNGLRASWLLKWVLIYLYS